jgi:RNA polymerase sigma-70 factor (ECF subfamily)
MNYLEPDWQQIVRDTGPRLFRYFSGTFPAVVASDLVQETLIRLVQKQRSGEFDPQKGNLNTYAFGIARFVRLETLKDSSAFELVDDEKKLDTPTHHSANLADQVSHLRWAIKQLKPIEQEILLLMIDADSQLEEIANALSLPLGTVKSHIHRAKEQLRKIMEVNI